MKKRTVYFNTKSCYGVETVDEITTTDFETYKDFRKELNSMLSNYHISGINVYTSNRCTNEWKNKE
jgi:hypothetical protein